MLQRLSVSNYILIDQLELDLAAGLNIITGETGAGKSILLGALGLLLGERADKSVLLDKSKKTVIEGLFKAGNKSITAFFRENDLDFEGDIILRREIGTESSGGKSRSFINDTPVSLTLLQSLGELLVDIHSQHETLFLRNANFQLSVLDAFAGVEAELDAYQSSFLEYKTLQQQLKDLEEEEKKSKADKDYYEFLYRELEEAKLKTDEQPSLESELSAMTHSEEIKSGLNIISAALSGEEDNIIARVGKLQSLIQASVKHFASLEELSNRLHSVVVELKDINNEVENISEKVVFDPTKIEEMDARLNEIYRLEQKHRVHTTEELLQLKDQFETRLRSIESLDEQIAALNQKISQQKSRLVEAAKTISEKRNKAIPKAEKEISALLTQVNLPNAVFKIENTVSGEEAFSQNGLDNIRFLFSANRGVAVREIGKVASGGELSRLMLCIKTSVARLMSLPTMIFDEIDTGISGETAVNVGQVLKQLSSKHQLIAITHLPQIASRGGHHLYVYKEIGKGKTAARVKALNPDERIVEIAKMLSGEKPTAVAIENAKEMINTI